MNKVEKESIIKDENGNKYYVFNTVDYNDKNYAICTAYNNANNISVFEYRFLNEQLEIRKEHDEKSIQEILLYSLEY